MRHLMLGADVDQFIELRVHGDEVHAERLAGECLGRCNLLIEQLGRHRPAGDHAEPARIGDCRDQMALADPAHRPAHDRPFGAEELRPACHQFLEAEHARVAMNRARLRDQTFTAHSAFSRGASRPKAVWSMRTASSISSSATSTLTLISLALTASRLMPRSASVAN